MSVTCKILASLKMNSNVSGLTALMFLGSIAAVACNEEAPVELPRFHSGFASFAPKAITGEPANPLTEVCGQTPQAGAHSSAENHERFVDFFRCALPRQLRSHVFGSSGFQLTQNLLRLDQSLAHIEQKAVPGSCADRIGKEFNSEFRIGSTSINLGLPHHLSCWDGEHSWIAWGRSDKGHFYLREGRGHRFNTLVSKLASGLIRGVVVSADQGSSKGVPSGILGFIMQPDRGLIHVSLTGQPLAFGCGLHAIIGPSHILVRSDLATTQTFSWDCAGDFAAATNSPLTGKYKNLEFCYSLDEELTPTESIAECENAGLVAPAGPELHFSFTKFESEWATELFQDPPPDVAKLSTDKATLPNIPW